MPLTRSSPATTDTPSRLAAADGVLERLRANARRTRDALAAGDGALLDRGLRERETLLRQAEPLLATLRAAGDGTRRAHALRVLREIQEGDAALLLDLEALRDAAAAELDRAAHVRTAAARYTPARAHTGQRLDLRR